MRRSLILIVLLMPIALMSQDLKMLDKKKGFRDIQLGSRIDDQNCMFKMTSEYAGKNELTRQWDYYNSLCKYKKINNVDIKQILLNTVNNKIAEILIKVEANNTMLDSLKLLYGEPSYMTPTTNVYFWRTKKIELRFLIQHESMSISFKDYKLSALRAKLIDKEKINELQEQF